MKVRNKLILLALGLLTFQIGYAQEISLAQSSDNAFTESEPGKFIATFNSSDATKDSYMINGYLGIGFNLGRRWELALTAELQRNTLIKKEQNVQQYGLKLSRLAVFKGNVTTEHANGTASTSSVEKFMLKMGLSGKYSNDRIDDTEGAQMVWSNSLTVPVEFKGKKKYALNALRPNTYFPKDAQSGLADYLQIRHNHNLGLEYISYEKLMMLNASFGIELYPFSGLLYDKFKKYSLLQLKYSIVDRTKLNGRATNLYIGSQQILGAALNFKFDDVNAFTIGYEYVDGGNPMKGLVDQHYGQFAVGVKINIE